MINIKMDKKTRDVSVAIERLNNANKEGLKQGFIAMGNNLVRQTQAKILSEPKLGRNYPIRSGGVIRMHRASAPSQAPALLSGEYYEGLQSVSNGWKGLEFQNTAEHAEYLELGTKNMKRRPGMANAIKDNLRNNRLYLENSIAKALK